MKTQNNKEIRWFLNELPVLTKEKIIDYSIEKKLAEYYLTKIKKIDTNKIVFTVLSIIASLFIIGGIILLIGYNWSALTQEVKTAIAFFLLLISQGLSLYFLFISKKELHAAVKEGISLFWAISFGAAVAAIGQIYHIPADTEKFIFIWCISSLVIIYVFNSLSVVALYLYLSITLISIMQNNDSVGLFFLPLLAVLIPHYLKEYKNYSSIRAALYNYFLITATIIGLGISLEKNIPGLWIVCYSSLFVFYYLLGILYENKEKEESLFYSPLKIAGIIGAAVFAYLLSWEWAWEEIGWFHYRVGEKFHDLASIYDYSISGLLPLLGIFLAFLIIKKKKFFNYILSSFGLLIVFLYLFVTYTENTLAVTWIINLYILTLALYGFYAGYKKNSLLTININMLFLTTTIVSRFFDENMSLLGRGIVFIICGIIILLVNFKFVKKPRKQNE